LRLVKAKAADAKIPAKTLRNLLPPTSLPTGCDKVAKPARIVGRRDGRAGSVPRRAVLTHPVRVAAADAKIPAATLYDVLPPVSLATGCGPAAKPARIVCRRDGRAGAAPQCAVGMRLAAATAADAKFSDSTQWRACHQALVPVVTTVRTGCRHDWRADAVMRPEDGSRLRGATAADAKFSDSTHEP